MFTMRNLQKKKVKHRDFSECISCGKTMIVTDTYERETEWGIASYEIFECKPCLKKEHIIKEFKIKMSTPKNSY